jgi:hypothetical protein
MRYRNTRIQVLLLRANDLRFDAEASVLMLRDAGQCALLAAG